METQRDWKPGAGEALTLPGASSGRLLRRLTSGLPSLPMAAWILLFVGVPGGFMLVFSFMTYTWYDVELPFTFDNYTELVGAGPYFKLLIKTLLIALFVTVATLLVASPFVYYIARFVSRPVAVALLLLTVLPLWMNTVIRNYAWLAVVIKGGMINTVLSAVGIPSFKILFTLELVLVVGVSLALPFAVLVLYATMVGISHEVEEASFDLGSSRFQTLERRSSRLPHRAIKRQRC